ncbi:MAG: efflux RND transporter periplasmic adaptor subunit [Candidatus Gastranaerophilales bacterium]|nr:efflux RND transporter periplasmic adaptor subunit [Candidatus Gastranaerophilales bacterium]
MRALALIFLLFSLVVISGCVNKITEETPEIYKIVHSPKMIYTGTVKFQYVSSLSFQESGIITYSPLARGDFVKKGQILAKIDDTLYRIKRNEESALLSELEIKYKQSKSYYDRITILHNAGAISDNDWETAGYETSARLKEISLQKEKLNYSNKQIQYATLFSPYDGFVYEKTGEIGEFASSGKPVISIIGSSKTQVEIMVENNIINKLHLNDNVVLNKNNIKYMGKISHISQSSNNTGGYAVKILLDKFYPDLKEGMNLDVEILNINKDKVLVPVDAIIKENNKKYVYKIEDIKENIGTIRKTEVLTDKIKDDFQEVTFGLKIGDYIILRGWNDNKQNKKIKI